MPRSHLSHNFRVLRTTFFPLMSLPPRSTKEDIWSDKHDEHDGQRETVIVGVLCAVGTWRVRVQLKCLRNHPFSSAGRPGGVYLSHAPARCRPFQPRVGSRHACHLGDPGGKRRQSRPPRSSRGSPPWPAAT